MHKVTYLLYKSMLLIKLNTLSSGISWYYKEKPYEQLNGTGRTNPGDG